MTPEHRTGHVVENERGFILSNTTNTIIPCPIFFFSLKLPSGTL